MPPKVSVLALTYNHAPYAAEMIEGVLRQKTSFPFELVIGDDASTDGTRDVIARYRQQAPGVVRPLFHEKNVGVTRNTARTLEHCTGKYIALLDGDDYWISPDKLQIQADLLDAHPETALCGHRAQLHAEGVAQADTTYDLALGFCPQDRAPGFYTIEDLLRGNFIPTSSAMFRNGLTPVFPKWFSESYVQDWPLYILIARHGGVTLLEAILSAYRIHPGSFTTSQGEIFRLKGRINLLDSLIGDFEKGRRRIIGTTLFQYEYWLSRVLLTAGETEEARSYFRRCLRLPSPASYLGLKAILGLLAYAPGLAGFLMGVKRGLTPGRGNAR